MYQTMEIYMARKKRVSSQYNPDSKRIFDANISDDAMGDSMLNKNHTQRRNSPTPTHPREPERRNCPHPWHSRFLRHNVRWLNEPFCYVATESTDAEQTNWWPSRTSEESLKDPPKSMETVQRCDFQGGATVHRNTRHTSNPFTIPAKGILPVNEPKRNCDSGDCLLESISFKHGYNSRLDRNEPIRGKLHGSFVWDRVGEIGQNKVIVTPWNQRHVHRCVTVPVTKQEQTTCSAKMSNPAPESPQAQGHETADLGPQLKVLPPIDGLPAPSS